MSKYLQKDKYLSDNLDFTLLTDAYLQQIDYYKDQIYSAEPAMYLSVKYTSDNYVNILSHFIPFFSFVDQLFVET